MIASVLILALLAAELLLLGRAWLGPWAPDLFVPVAALLSTSLPSSRLPLCALALGWMRALVLLEPVGGQVLCALVALSASALLGGVGGLRGLPRSAGVVALCWYGTASLLGRFALPAGPPHGGTELLMGALVVLPLAVVGAWRRARQLRLA